MELPAKHVNRVVSGTRTTGVGETIFLKYKENYNELKEILRETDVPVRTFPWEKYKGTSVEALAREVVIWGKTALRDNMFDRGDYRLAWIPGL